MRVTKLIILALAFVFAGSKHLLAQDTKEQLRNAVIVIPTANLPQPAARPGITVTTDPEIVADNRVYVVNATWMEGAVNVSNSYVAVVDAGDILEKGATPPNPMPDLVLKNTGHLYVSGIRPVVGTRTVTANAQGSTIEVSIFVNEANETIHRVHYVEGAFSKFVWVYPRQGDHPPAVLTVGTYMDAKVTGPADQPTFHSWKQNLHGTTGRPIPDLATTAMLNQLDASVQQALVARN